MKVDPCITERVAKGLTSDEISRRLRLLLPPEYHESYTTLDARPMGSAGLVYDNDGRVAWDQIWQRFCDLAIAGGPPHKGRLLEPGHAADIGARPDEHLDVLEELGRGITMASELPTTESPHLGWIRVLCHSETMAGWMLRAITAENVAVRRDGRALDLPAAPAFRLDKEIKNVVTVVAKTTHYWMGHIPSEQRTAIKALFTQLDQESPLVEPQWPEDGLPAWRTIECPSVSNALRTMQNLIAANVLSRREGTSVLIPVD